MNINFEYDDVKASNRLEIMAAEKLQKLISKFDFIVNADVYFKTENTSDPNTGFICNIRLNTPGSTLFSVSSNANFETSIANSISDLDRQLQKRKAKMKMR
ncbi:putative sigma-54 modulation protein [Maribacter vaceletii]|uniref:Putative sigma-54 modulation protein n=1 Tax=Maribacter vaceletii TaxID=1206816 RepID=A0A495EB76_9FLAO|nr:ribosome-associated translation inhibitor RaiA [Maribacter vaceletii]RKR13147.1 putative sigma-54 modulation protein [Maribacter vaceletii]